MNDIELKHELAAKFNLTWLQAENLFEFLQGEDIMDSYVEEAVYSFYMDSGEMPYGVAKARDGDPAEWIYNQLSREYNL